MNEIGKRIAEARVAKGMNQSELARALGVTPQAVQKWEAGGAPKGARLREVADILGVTVEHLLAGVDSVDVAVLSARRREYQQLRRQLMEERGIVDPRAFDPDNPNSDRQLAHVQQQIEKIGRLIELAQGPANVEPGPDLRGHVPLISWVQAGNWEAVIDNFAPGDAEDWLPCPRKFGPHAFALRVRGVSMEPKYQDGDIIFVDPDAQAEHGKNIVVRLDDEHEATFKQLVMEGGQKFLRALNPDWPGPKLIPINGNATICGVVIGKWVPE